MPLECSTHILGRAGRCQRCSILLPQPTKEGNVIYAKAGDRIGVIRGGSVPPQSYIITSHDSNRPCETVPRR